MTARRRGGVAAWVARAALVLGASACAATPSARGGSAPMEPASAAPMTPSCGPWLAGQPWPTPRSEGRLDAIVLDGELEGTAASAELMVACGDRIAAVTCEVSFSTTPRVYVDHPRTHVVARPAVAAADLVARVRSRFSREGFEETWSGGGSMQQMQALAATPLVGGAPPTTDVARIGTIEASFLGAAGGRSAGVATRRGELERLILVVCSTPQHCAIRVMEVREACDAPGGHELARLREDQAPPVERELSDPAPTPAR